MHTNTQKKWNFENALTILKNKKKKTPSKQLSYSETNLILTKNKKDALQSTDKAKGL